MYETSCRVSAVAAIIPRNGLTIARRSEKLKQIILIAGLDEMMLPAAFGASETR